MLEHEGKVLRVRNYTIERQTGKQEVSGLRKTFPRQFLGC